MNWRTPEIRRRYHQILRDLSSNNADIEGCLLITTDGVVIAAELPESMSAEASASILAKLASMMSLATILINDADKGHINQLYIKLEHGYIIVLPMYDDALLITICRENAQLGLIFLDLGRGRNQFLTSSPEGIIPPRPPGSLTAGAAPEYDDSDE